MVQSRYILGSAIITLRYGILVYIASDSKQAASGLIKKDRT